MAASGKIRGITIELDGDTSGLTKSLSDANKEIKNTQTQLKDVERLLKLDPTNTELLRQKQELLGKAEANLLPEAIAHWNEEVDQTERGEAAEDVALFQKESLLAATRRL